MFIEYEHVIYLRLLWSLMFEKAIDHYLNSKITLERQLRGTKQSFFLNTYERLLCLMLRNSSTAMTKLNYERGQILSINL